MSLGRTLRWARHLRPSQMLHRLWYRVRQPLFATAAYSHLLPDGGAIKTLPPPAPWPGDAATGAAIALGTMPLLGQQHPTGDWRAEGKSHLWRFTLHYFEWLADLRAAGQRDAARNLVRSWLDAHDRPDPLAWHPYPTSLRLVSWLDHAAWLLDGADAAFTADFRRSLARQSAHLARVVERDVGGNHIIKNLKALIVAGRCLDGDHSRWLEELRRQVKRQVLADGCHYERSPAYHAQVLADLVDLRRVLGDGVDWLDHAIAAMAGALRFLRHGDGGLALFNDGHVGESAWLAALDRQLPDTALPAALDRAGYYRLEAGPALVLLDAGQCGPDELPAHAHADTLSLEFSWGAERVVVNCGTYAYQDPAWRNRLRGTAAHSTLAVAGQDSAEVFGAFRLGRRPKDVGATWDGEWLSAHHDGYRHLGVVHRRRLRLTSAGLDGEDSIEGAILPAEILFHLHPDVAAERRGEIITLRTPSGLSLAFTWTGAACDIIDTIYAPHFGTMIPARALRLTPTGTGGCWSFTADVSVADESPHGV